MWKDIRAELPPDNQRLIISFEGKTLNAVFDSIERRFTLDNGRKVCAIMNPLLWSLELVKRENIASKHLMP